jgi:MFS family permease
LELQVKEKSPFNSAWIIVGVSSITLALVYGVFHSFSVFFVAVIKEFGWSHSIASGAFSLFLIILSLIGPFVGGMIDRFDPKKVFLLGSFFLGTGLALCSWVHSLWQFYLFFGVLTAVGVGFTGWVPSITMIQYWFKEKRGLAVGIISSGVGIGIFICIPFIQHLINQVGWRMAYRTMAFFIPLIIITVAIVFLKKPPKTAAPSPPEKEIIRTTIKDPLVIDKEWASQSWTIRKAITKKQFWLLSFSIFLSFFIIQSILTHQVAFFVEQGLEALFASYIVGIVGIVSIAGKILCGALSDKMGREVIYTIGNILLICGIALLIAFPAFPSPYLPYFYGVFFGMGYSASVALYPLITADFFEGHAYGSIFGTIQIVCGFGAALGAWFAGFVYDQVGSYIPFFIIIMPCAFFACLSLWWAAPRNIRVVPGKRG